MINNKGFKNPLLFTVRKEFIMKENTKMKILSVTIVAGMIICAGALYIKELPQQLKKSSKTEYEKKKLISLYKDIRGDMSKHIKEKYNMDTIPLRTTIPHDGFNLFYSTMYPDDKYVVGGCKVLSEYKTLISEMEEA